MITPPKSVVGRDNGGSAAAVTVVRDASGPQYIQPSFESSRLGRALKEHISKDPLWRHLSNWRTALLEEIQRRADLNRAIRKKVEQVFGLRVILSGDPQEAWLAPGTIWWIRARLTNAALGNYVPPVDEDIKERSLGSLETRYYGQLLVQNVEEAQVHLQNTIAAFANHDELKAAAQSFRNLQVITSSARNAIDEYLLIHHIPGRCGLCKKLGGR